MARTFRILLLSAAVVALPLSAHASLITNGSFECDPGGACPGSGSWVTLALGSPLIPGWVVADSPSIGGLGTVDWIGAYWQAADGARSVDLNGNNGAGGVEQAIATIIGQTYRLRFAIAGNPDGAPDPKLLTAVAGSTSAPFSFSVAGKTRPNMGWQYYSMLFTATSGSTVIGLYSGTAGAFYGPAVDNVSVNAVPEPAALSLMAAGVMAFGRSLRTRRRT